MALFNFYNFDKPGPGINPGEPRKTGIRRVLELLELSGGNLFKGGLLSFLTFLPWYVGTLLSIRTHALAFMFLAGILGGMIAAPQVVGIADTALRAMRDEPGLWWMTYKAAWKRNWKASLLPGAIAGCLVSALVFSLAHLDYSSVSLWTLVLYLLSAWFLFGMITYVIPQIALFDMSLKGILVNSVMLQLRYPKRTFGAVLIQILYWGAFVLFYPISPIVLPITGLWLPLFLGLCAVYNAIEEAFDLERIVKEAQENKKNETQIAT